jgi:hypothetical protein
MYRTCRHIKPNGLRCESPALKETYFCYFHMKLHNVGAEVHDKYGNMRLPSPESPAAIQLSIAKINDALINGRIDPKRAGQLLYSMQIASMHLGSHCPSKEDGPVESFSQDCNGDEIAPEKFVCAKEEDCSKCPCFIDGQCPGRPSTKNEIETAETRADGADDAAADRGEQSTSAPSLISDPCSLISGGFVAKTGCETVPLHLTQENSVACSLSAPTVQPLCDCKVAVTQT